jgi:hypothetical protein
MMSGPTECMMAFVLGDANRANRRRPRHVEEVRHDRGLRTQKNEQERPSAEMPIPQEARTPGRILSRQRARNRREHVIRIG